MSPKNKDSGFSVFITLLIVPEQLRGWVAEFWTHSMCICMAPAGAADVVDREVFEQGTVWLHRGGKKAEKAEKCYN